MQTPEDSPQVPIRRCIDTKAVVHLLSGILCGCKKEGTLTLCDSMDGPGDYYAKRNKSVGKDKYHIISLICGI